MHAIDGMACAKRGCDNRGTLGLNIVGHGSFPTKWGRRWRYRCTVCGGTVSTHTGTAYSGLRCARRECDQVASLRVEGVSISATARVTGHARHTIARWLERASTAAKRFHQRMGPLAPGQRWSASRKRVVVLRLLRGESLDAVSREVGVELYRLEAWKERALVGLELGLKNQAGEPATAALDTAKRHLGELSMEVELLRERARAAERRLPLPMRRSRR